MVNARRWNLMLATLGGAAALHLILAACGQHSSSVAQCQTGDCAGGSSSGGAGLTPSGAIVAFGGTSPPAGWLVCDGSTPSRTQYASLFAAIGTAHGSGDGATTFNLPDYRGRFLRGVDEGTARDPDAAQRAAANSGGNVGDGVGSLQGAAFATHDHVLIDPGHGHDVVDPGHSHGVSDPGHAHATSVSGSQFNAVWAAFPNASTACFNSGSPPYCYENSGVNIDRATTGIAVQGSATGISIQVGKTGITVAPQGGSIETRPVNAAVTWIIKT